MADNETKTEETKTEETKGSKKSKTPERVEVFIPKGAANDDPNMFVSINGTNYLLPRGKTSMVPPEVKHEIERAFKAQNIQDERIYEMSAAASK